MSPHLNSVIAMVGFSFPFNGEFVAISCVDHGVHGRSIGDSLYWMPYLSLVRSLGLCLRLLILVNIHNALGGDLIRVGYFDSLLLNLWECCTVIIYVINRIGGRRCGQ